MPNWISKDGVWTPADEVVSLVDHEGKDGRQPGEPYIYKGPDRAALFELYKSGVEVYGSDFRHDPDFILRVKQLGFKDIEEYLEFVGYDPKKVEAKVKETKEKIIRHEPPEKKPGIDPMGGGIDTSGGGNDKKGGFGKQPD